METLPTNCSDDDIRSLVLEWWELIAAGQYQRALDMFAHDDSQGIVWTPQTLEEGIATGCTMTPPRGRPLSLRGHEDRDRILRLIEVDRAHLFGLDPEKYCGMVHFEELPLEPCIGDDVTARFAIMKVGPKEITLEFHDAHVM